MYMYKHTYVQQNEKERVSSPRYGWMIDSSYSSFQQSYSNCCHREGVQNEDGSGNNSQYGVRTCTNIHMYSRM